MAKQPKNWRTKNARNRIYVHPQEDFLQCEEGVFAPGQRVPDYIADSDMGREWLQMGLLIEEVMYRMYHGADWNSRYPQDKVGPGSGGVDIITERTMPVTGDEITDPSGAAPTISGGGPADLGD